MVVRKSTRVHEQPTLPRVTHRTVVPQEPAAAALEVHIYTELMLQLQHRQHFIGLDGCSVTHLEC